MRRCPRTLRAYATRIFFLGVFIAIVLTTKERVAPGSSGELLGSESVGFSSPALSTTPSLQPHEVIPATTSSPRGEMPPSGAVSPGLTEALGEALRQGGCTPALSTAPGIPGSPIPETATKQYAPSPASEAASKQDESTTLVDTNAAPKLEHQIQIEEVQDDMASYWAIWVGGISADIIENDLVNLFSPHAQKRTLLSVYIRRQDRRTLGADDLGFVNFYNEEDAQRAYENLKDKAFIRSKKLKLKAPKKKTCNMQQLKDYHSNSIVLADKRPNRNIPVTTRSVVTPPRSRGSSNPSGGRSRFQDVRNLSRRLANLHVQNRTRRSSDIINNSPLNFDVPWIDSTPRNIQPYYVARLNHPSAPLVTIRQHRNDGLTIFHELQKGTLHFQEAPHRVPFLSFSDCPGWVPDITLPYAIRAVQRGDIVPEKGTNYVLLLVVLGPPKHGDYSLDLGVLQAIRNCKDDLGKPAVPLVNRFYMGLKDDNGSGSRMNPKARPSSYLLPIRMKFSGTSDDSNSNNVVKPEEKRS